MPELWCLTVDTIQLAPLIESLDSSDDLSVTSLGRCLERCTFDIEELVKLVEDVKAKEGISYDRRVAHRTETYEIAIIRWPQGASTDLHGHGDAQCAFTILEGRTSEHLHDESGSYLRTRHHDIGDIVLSPYDLHHRIENVEERDLVHLHVYSPPLPDVQA